MEIENKGQGPIQNQRQNRLQRQQQEQRDIVGNSERKLNEYQKMAVLDESRACVVNACVGSGKTTVLIEKLLHLHNMDRVSYADMVVLTFTNKAAVEIKERLMRADRTVTEADMPYFGTFHSVALTLLRQKLSVDMLGYEEGFMVMEPEDELDMASYIIKRDQLRVLYKNRLKKRLEQARIADLNGNRVSRYDDDLFELYDTLQSEKVKENKMTFSDLIENCAVLLEIGGEEVPAFKWVVIDEVQDTDAKQLEFIDRLIGGETKLFAVGDPNQVIYSWRSGDVNVFYRLKKTYDAKELSLPVNYRSKAFIIEAARMFQQKGERLEGARGNEDEDAGSVGTVESDGNSGSVGNTEAVENMRFSGNDKIVLKNHYNAFNEAEYLADKIKVMHDSGAAYGEIAVFYRVQEQSTILENVLKRHGIPYEVSLKKTIRDIPVLDWIIKLLRAAVNQDDITSRESALEHKNYGVKTKEREKYEKLLDGFKDWVEAMNEASCEGNTDQAEALQIEDRKSVGNALSGINAKELYVYFELDHRLRPTSADYVSNKEEVMRFLDIVMEYCQEQETSLYTGLQQFLNSAALYGINILKKDIVQSSDTVKLMTLHGSKGLEFKYVFITGVNYGLIPLRTKSFEEDEEERRLFFVGITRAKDYLEMSYYTSPEYHQAVSGASRYISMIPSELIETQESGNTGNAGNTGNIGNKGDILAGGSGEPNSLGQNSQQVAGTKKVDLHALKKQIQAELGKGNSMLQALAWGEEEHKSSKAKVKNSELVKNSEQVRCGETDLDAEKSTARKDQEDDQRDNQKKARHAKYGIGVVVAEDDVMISVEFTGYGVKEFIKAFAEIEILE